MVCDARLLSGELQMLETTLTESRTPVKKSALHILPEDIPCESRSNMVFASSVVVSGTARAAAVVTGERTYAFVREGYIPVRAGETAGLLEKLTGWCRSVSLVMIAAVLLLTLGGVLWGRSGIPLDSLFLSALALAVASMSEFLCVVANIILACSMQMLKRSSGGRAVLKNADSAENFAQARGLVFSTEQMLLSDRCLVDRWYCEGIWREAPEEGKGDARLLSLIRTVHRCCGAGNLALAAADSVGGEEHPLSALCGKLLQSCSGGTSVPCPVGNPVASSDENGLRTVLIPSENGMQAYICGELRDVLACCSHQYADGEIRSLLPEQRQSLLSEAEAYERRCAHVVAAAVRMSPFNDLTKVSALHNKMTLVGFFAVVFPVDLALVRYAAACRKSGTRMVLFTESPARARYIAAEAGILTERDRFLDLSAGMSGLQDWLQEEETCAVIHTPAGTDRSALVRKIRERLPDLVFAGAELRDLQVYTEVSASAAAGLDRAGCPSCLYRSADALAGRKTEEENAHCCAALETLRIIGFCRGAFANLRGSAEYLLLSQTVRLFLILASVLLGEALFSPVLILLWGLILDYAAVLTLAFRAPCLSDLRMTAKKAALPSLRDGLLFPICAGALTAVLLAAVPAAGSALGIFASSGEKMFLLYMGGILASALAAVRLLKERTAGLRINAAEAVYGLLLAAVSIMAWLYYDPVWSTDLLLLLLLAFLPVLLLGILFVIHRRFRDGKDEKE